MRKRLSLRYCPYIKLKALNDIFKNGARTIGRFDAILESCTKFWTLGDSLKKGIVKKQSGL